MSTVTPTAATIPQSGTASQANRDFLMHLIAYIVVVGVLVFLFHAEATNGNKFGIKGDQPQPPQLPIQSNLCFENLQLVPCPPRINPPVIQPSIFQIDTPMPYRLYILLPNGNIRHWLSEPVVYLSASRSLDGLLRNVALDAAAMFSWTVGLFWGALLASHFVKSWMGNAPRAASNAAYIRVNYFIRHAALFICIGLAFMIVNFDIRFHDVLTIIINRYSWNDPAPIVNAVTKFPWAAVIVGAWFILLAIHCVAILDDWRVVMAQSQTVAAKEVNPKAS
jgi:hypothetical protein